MSILVALLLVGTCVLLFTNVFLFRLTTSLCQLGLYVRGCVLSLLVDLQNAVFFVNSSFTLTHKDVLYKIQLQELFCSVHALWKKMHLFKLRNSITGLFHYIYQECQAIGCQAFDCLNQFDCWCFKSSKKEIKLFQLWFLL